MSDEIADREPQPLLDHPLLAEMVSLSRRQMSAGSGQGSDAGNALATMPWRLRLWEKRALADVSGDESESTIAAAIVIAASIPGADPESESQVSELAQHADPAGDWPGEISARLGALSRECVNVGEIARATELATTRASLEKLLTGSPRELLPCAVAEPSAMSRQWLERRRAYSEYAERRRTTRPAWRAFSFLVAAVGLVAGLAFLQPPQADIRELAQIELEALSPYLGSAYVREEGNMFFGTLAAGWSDLDSAGRRGVARSLSEQLTQAGHSPALIFDATGRLVVSYREGRLWVDPAAVTGGSRGGS